MDSSPHDGYQSIMMMAVAIAAALGMACIAATVLAIQLKAKSPALHEQVDAPTGLEWTPFRVFHFLSPAKWRCLPGSLKPLAGLSIGGLLMVVFLLVLLLVCHAAKGGSL